MDQPLARGTYIQAGGAAYLVVQHAALGELPTVVALPATVTPLPHRPPLIIRDNTNDLWIHTYAPATILKVDITATTGQAPNTTTDTAAAALASIVDTPTGEPASPDDHGLAHG